MLKQFNDENMAIQVLNVLNAFRTDLKIATAIMDDLHTEWDSPKEEIMRYLEAYQTENFKNILWKTEENKLRWQIGRLNNIIKNSPEVVNEVLNLMNEYANNSNIFSNIGNYFEDKGNSEHKKIVVERFKTEKFKQTINLVKDPATPAFDSVAISKVIEYTVELGSEEEYLSDELIQILRTYPIEPRYKGQILEAITKASKLMGRNVQTEVIEEIKTEEIKKLHTDPAAKRDKLLPLLIKNPTQKEKIYNVFKQEEEMQDKFNYLCAMDAMNLHLETEEEMSKALDMLLDKERNTKRIASLIIGVSKDCPSITKKYIQLCEKIKADTEFYVDVALTITQPPFKQDQKKLDTLITHADYFNQKERSEIIPISKIMISLECEQVEKLKTENKTVMRNLIIAHDIASRNINPETITEELPRGRNYLEEFYAGLRDTIDFDYENISKWADTIISGLKEVARTGKSLDEVMGR